MGVDYYACDCCGDALYEEYVSDCNSCGVYLCVDCLVDKDGVSKDGRYTYPFSGDDGEIDSKHCPYCEGSEIKESEFISFLLKNLGKSREEMEEEFRNRGEAD